MELKVNLDDNSYSIIIGNNILDQIDKYYSFNRKVLVISDNMIPNSYSSKILSKCKNGYKYVIKSGEKSKNIDNFLAIQEYLLNNQFDRNDLIVAVGGGVIGDLSAFVASTYKRGIDFINVPTSTLAMIDSSVGGKTAVNFKGIKNVIGTFYQPKLVFIDFDVLKTLDERNYNNGLIEALKIGIIKDNKIIELFNNYQENLQEIIIRSLKAKIEIVEKDEKEKGIRKILNFGHTIGHALEVLIPDLLHGEAVAKGMLFMLEGKQKEKIEKIIRDLNIPLNYNIDIASIVEVIKNDKKACDNMIDMIVIEDNQIMIRNKTLLEIKEILKEEK